MMGRLPREYMWECCLPQAPSLQWLKQKLLAHLAGKKTRNIKALKCCWCLEVVRGAAGVKRLRAPLLAP